MYLRFQSYLTNCLFKESLHIIFFYISLYFWRRTRKEHHNRNQADQWTVWNWHLATERDVLTLASSMFIWRDKAYAVLHTIYLQSDSIINYVAFTVVCFLFFKSCLSLTALSWIMLTHYNSATLMHVAKILLVVRRAQERLYPPVETIQMFGLDELQYGENMCYYS